MSRSCLHSSRTRRVRTLNVWYYEFMCFDVPKVVQSPGYDHGHDEESRNGRDMKIDILEAYVWILEVFRVKSGFYRSTGRLPEPPGSLMGHSGPCGEEERRPRQGRVPLPPSPNRTRRGGRRPPFLPLSLLFPPLLLVQQGKGRESYSR